LSFLRSEVQIQSDLRIIANAQIEAHSGNASSLIHTTKELASLLMDQKLIEDTLLSSRYTIHGKEVGIKSNQIFSSFTPLGLTLGKYAESFGLFRTVRNRNRTLVIPLLTAPLDISDIVDNPRTFSEEAKVLGMLKFGEKNVLATHRNLTSTMEAHKTVSRLFLRTSSRLAQVIRKPNTSVNYLVNKMNECADELVKKSNYYPHQATLLKNELLESEDSVKQFLGMQIEPHEQLINKTVAISKAILRGSHLVRSLLNENGLYSAASTSRYDNATQFKEECEKAGLDSLKSWELADVKKVVQFLIDTVCQKFIWWRDIYGNVAD
jgi:hypothetical protein